jgi:drug/metabolite transporter (DMT)-like permease
MKAVGALGICTLGWTFAPVFIRLLRHDYDPLTQGFIRYLFGALFLLAVCFVYHRSALLTLIRNPAPVIGISILNTVQQYAWTAGTYGATATTAQLIVKLSIVFVVIFAYLLFHEERAVIRNPLYIIGTVLSLVGVAGVLIRDPQDLSLAFTRGNLLLMFCALTWAVYAVWGKHIVLNIHPLPMFAVIASLTAIGLGTMAVIFEEPTQALHAGIGPTALIVLSGILAIGGSHPSFHYAQRHFGSAFTNTFTLIMPLTTYCAAWFILPSEKLSMTQGIGAFILLFGTFLIIVVENRKRTAEPEAPVLNPGTTPSPAAERTL